MYVWIAVLFNELFESKIREELKPIGTRNNLDFVTFSLPQHISLKISFQCDECDFLNIVDDVKRCFEQIKPFPIELGIVEQLKGWQNIIWITVKDNDILKRLHEILNQTFLENYGIELNPYDGAHFRFHSTLFIDDKNILTKNYDDAFEELQNLTFNQKQMINTACIGISKTGKMGEFEVFTRIKL